MEDDRWPREIRYDLEMPAFLYRGPCLFLLQSVTNIVSLYNYVSVYAKSHLIRVTSLLDYTRRSAIKAIRMLRVIWVWRRS